MWRFYSTSSPWGWLVNQSRHSKHEKNTRLRRLSCVLVFCVFDEAWGPMSSSWICSLQKQPSRAALMKRCSENMQQTYRKTAMPKCDFKKQLYWNYLSAWMFSCKFAAYFQNIFSSEHLWSAASLMSLLEIIVLKWATSSFPRECINTYMRCKFDFKTTLHRRTHFQTYFIWFSDFRPTCC